MNKKIICSFLALTMVMTSVVGMTASASETAAQIYVSQSGSDSADGTSSAPFKTIKRAIQSVTHYNNNNQKAEVILMDNSYTIDDTIKLDDIMDVTFKPYGERTTLRGNTILDGECEPDAEILAKIPTDVQSQIKCIDLSEILDEDEIIEQATHTKASNFLYSDILLYSQDTMMQRAKWPNEGFMTVGNVYDAGASEGDGDTAKRGFVISYDDANIDNWTGDNIWAEGYGVYLWAYDKIKVASIDKTNKKITSEPMMSYTGIAQNGKLVFSNIIEELDVPGEWYFDDTANKLYYYPVDNSSLEITTRKDSLLEINNSKNITFEGIDFKGTRGVGVAVNNSENVVFTDCSVSQIGKTGISFENCEDSGMINSAVYDCGAGGINLDGGIKENLSAGKNFIQNCVITRFSNIVPVSSPGISISGVGNCVKNNTIYDAWQMAVTISGNNNQFIGNEIFDVVKGSSDASAIYSYSNSSSRGIEIKGNYIHHLGVGYENPSRMGVSAIYLDGWTSSRTIENNIFYDCVAGVNINGGSDNTVNNNLFIDTPVSVFAQSVTSNPVVYWSHLKNAYIDKEVWNKEYAGENMDYNITNGEDVMKNNIISDNMMYNSSASNANYTSINDGMVTTSNDVVLNKTDFNDYDNQDFTLVGSYASNPINSVIMGAGATITGPDLISDEKVEYQVTKSAEYIMNDIARVNGKKFVLNNVDNNTYPLNINSYGNIVAKNNSGVFANNRALYSSKGYYIVDNTDLAEKFNGEVSVNMWIKPMKSEDKVIVNVSEDDNDGPFVIRYAKASDTHFKLDFRRKFNSDYGYWFTDDSYEIGKWYNVCIRYNDEEGYKPEIYVNGVKASLRYTNDDGITDYPSGTAIAATSSMKVSLNGQNSSKTTSTYFGDIKIYDSIISHSMILDYYNETRKFYELNLNVKLFNSLNVAISDYNSVNPEGLQILVDTDDIGKIKIFSVSDDRYVGFSNTQTDMGILLTQIELEAGKTYKITDGNDEIKFTTTNE